MNNYSDRRQEPSQSVPRGQRSWLEKFRDAFRGVPLGVWGQNSFYAHFVVAAFVIATAVVLRVSTIEWCVLVLCITVVLTAEMFNTALEHISREVTGEFSQRIRDALDIGSAAVLMAAVGSVVVGTIVFLPRMLQLLYR